MCNPVGYDKEWFSYVQRKLENCLFYFILLKTQAHSFASSPVIGLYNQKSFLILTH